MGEDGDRGPEVIPCARVVHARGPLAVRDHVLPHILHIQGIPEAGAGLDHSVVGEGVIVEMTSGIADRDHQRSYFLFLNLSEVKIVVCVPKIILFASKIFNGMCEVEV